MQSVTDPKLVWKHILQELVTKMSRSHFLTWFKCTALLSMQDDTIVVGVPTSISFNNISTRYLEHLQQAANAVLGKELHIQLVVDGSLHRRDERVVDVVRLSAKADAEDESRQVATAPSSTMVSRQPAHEQAGRPRDAYGQEVRLVEGITSRVLNPKYTFESFIVGPDSQLAYAACQAVGRAPGVAYNPLFIYGGVGLGKTHLLHATGNDVLSRFPGKKVVYVTSEKFTNELIAAIGTQKTDELRKKYRSIDVLIIDDIQFLASKTQTQNEFFHTFNDLHEGKKQIIISSDKPPRELKDLTERLTSRFEMGMIVDVNFPDFETRCAILRQKCQEKNVLLSNDVIEFIAHNIHSSIRELEGVLNQALAQYELYMTMPTINSIGPILMRLNQHQALTGYQSAYQGARTKATTLSEVMEAVGKYYHIPVDDILGESRKKEIAHARQLVMYLCKTDLNMTYERVGEQMGGRLHSTVIHSCNKVTKSMQADEQLTREINTIRSELGLL